MPVVIQLKSFRTKTYYKLPHAIARFVLFNAATLPGMMAALGLLALEPARSTFFAASVILSMLVALYNAWILLIEIIR